MSVFKMRGGTVWHVVNETRSHARRKSAFIICGSRDALEGERRAGVPTCKKCLQLDNPFNLMPTEKAAIRRLAEGGQPFNLAGRGKLISIDLMTDDGCLSDRGKALARDFTEGTAPYIDENDVAHARHPLDVTTLCSSSARIVIAEYERLTVSRYQALRNLDVPVTCIPCLRAMR